MALVLSHLATCARRTGERPCKWSKRRSYLRPGRLRRSYAVAVPCCAVGGGLRLGCVCRRVGRDMAPADLAAGGAPSKGNANTTRECPSWRWPAKACGGVRAWRQWPARCLPAALCKLCRPNALAWRNRARNACRACTSRHRLLLGPTGGQPEWFQKVLPASASQRRLCAL